MISKLKELMNKITKAGLLHFVRNDRMVAFCHASIPQAFRTSYKKVAFTLAEVLITLGIIGVVAAMTIPTLNKKINEIVTVNKVTKVYATLSNALRMSTNDFGAVDTWNLENLSYHDGAVVFMDNFKKYLKISNDCAFTRGCITKDTYEIKNQKVVLSWADGYDRSTAYYKLELSDGSNMWMRTNGSDSCVGELVCAAFWFDINGKKAPNVIGKDIFIFNLYADKVLPAGTANPGKCLDASDGWSCAAYVIKYKNMKYLKNITE